VRECDFDLDKMDIIGVLDKDGFCEGRGQK
jgi:hypothetical protein